MSYRLALRFDPTGELHTLLLPRPLYLSVGVPRSRSPHPPTNTAKITRRKGTPHVSVQLKADQEVDLLVEARDVAGNTVPNPGVLTWSVDGGDVLTLTVDPTDQAKAVATTTGALGVATVVVSDDLDGDPTTAEAVGSLSFEIVAGDVVQITVSAGEPRSRL